MAQCEYCNNEIISVGKYSSGRFCNQTCANRHNSNKNREERNKKISASLLKIVRPPQPKRIFEYTCEKCGVAFRGEKIRKSYKKHCLACRRPERKRTKVGSTSILDVSKRTVMKILRRANIGCSICQWNAASCDIHHIIPKREGGTNDMSNLIVICPNCHRMAHEKIYSRELLFDKSIKTTLPNWQEYYNQTRERFGKGS